MRWGGRWPDARNETACRRLDAAAGRTFDRLVCWRTNEVGQVDALLAALGRHGIEWLAVAQSCAAMPE
jgi:hypothetical protein